MSLVKWFKAIYDIVTLHKFFHSQFDYFEQEINELRSKLDTANQRMLDAEKCIIERTSMNADLSIYDGNYVIAFGQYRGGDYIETFKIPNRDFEAVIKELQNTRKLMHLERIDGPPAIRHFVKQLI